MFEKITESDIAKRGVAAVANTPTRRVPFGESNMTPDELKARFDLLPKHLADRLNEVFEGLASGELADALMLKHGDMLMSIAQLARMLLEGDVDGVMVKTTFETLSLSALGARVVEMYNGLSTAELADKLMLSAGVSLAEFYRDEKRLLDKDYEAIANIVIAKLPDGDEVKY